MKKVFEDYFSELQADMVSICLEYVKDRAEKIYIYCSCEKKVISCNFFYCINNTIVKKHELNDSINNNLNEFEYDTSIERQKCVSKIIINDIERLYNLCKEYEKEMPTEMKLIYDVKNNSLKAEYRYDLVYSNDPVKFADHIAQEWFEEIKSKNNE